MLAFVLVMFCLSCKTERYLNPSDKLLDNYSLEYKPKQNKLPNNIEYEVRTYIRQKPNGNFLLIPREYIFLRNNEQGDSSWHHKWMRKTFGQFPTYYDQSQSLKSVEDMRNYLVNLKGYYDAEVDFLVEEDGQRVKIKYIISPKERYRVGSIQYLSEDKKIIKEITNLQEDKKLNEGDYIDVSNFTLEQSRIALALQNKGYANFASNYIETFGVKRDSIPIVDIYFKVNLPPGDTLHRKYKVGKINVYTDGESNSEHFDTLNIGYNSYFKRSNEYIIKPGTLNDKIDLRTGEFAQRFDRVNTLKQLYQLQAYRFVTISPYVNKYDSTAIDYDIVLTPHSSKWIADFGANTYYSTISGVGRQFLGISVGAQLQNRNLFNGGELFTISAESGFEYQINPFERRTYSLGIQSSLRLPKFKDFLGTAKLVDYFDLVSDSKISSFKKSSSTTISLSYNHTDIKLNYRINSYNASLSAKYQYNQEKSFQFSQLGFNLYDSDLTQDFLERINYNPLVIRSLRSNLVTGFLFKDFSFIYNQLKSNSGGSWSFLAYYELSGLEIHLLNKLIDSNNTWKLLNDTEYAKFQKLELDLRHYRYFNNRKRSWAFRLHGGIIVPFGEQTTAPFLKQFSVGGPNSVRGWINQELGPGGNIMNLDDQQSFFQKGDILLEASIEYRSDLFWILEGALFLDAGNVWTLKDDLERNDTKFGSDFYKQIAIAVGWGLRFDIEYFNIRFDFGYKVRTPYKNEDGSYWLKPRSTFSKVLGTPQIAINYPF